MNVKCEFQFSHPRTLARAARPGTVSDVFRVGVTRGLSFGLRPDATVPRMSCSEASLCTARSTAMAFRIRVLMLRHCFLSRDARDGELWPPRLIVRLIVMSAVRGRVSQIDRYGLRP